MSSVSSVMSTSSSSDATSAASSSSVANSLSMDDFFQLLAAQLQYQDPLSSDSSSSSSGTDYLGEMAQFAVLEETQNLYASNNYVLAASMVGKNATYSITSSGTTTTGSGTVTAVNLSGSTPACEIGGKWVSLSNITTVSSAS